MAFQLGLDTGGTYTDAVMINESQKIVASAKSLTTHTNLIEGLRGATEAVLSEQFHPITLVSVSTTLATNALVEGTGRPVCLLLIGFSDAQMQRAKLQQALGGDPHFFLDGGHNASGKKLAELDLQLLEKHIDGVAGKVDAFAISSVFAVRNPEHELAAMELIKAKTGMPVSCGHMLSSGLDAPRRALTALLNARLIPMISSLLLAARQLLLEHQIDCPLMVVKGDGSLVSADVALASPVETILSGPAASVVGAQFMCDDETMLVSDMGGTTTDIAMIQYGSPRLDPNGATIGGWRTMVSAIDVKTYGLGGDSAISYNRDTKSFDIGPQRVMPLSLLTMQHPHLLDILQEQSEEAYITTHAGQFVMAHSASASDLTAAQGELWEQIKHAPIALQTLFKQQTMERALTKLVQRGAVLLSGFTPSDASHVLQDQGNWERRGAQLGAVLMQRYAAENMGQTFASIDEFCRSIQAQVSHKTALALINSVVDDPSSKKRQMGMGLSDSQKALLESAFISEAGKNDARHNDNSNHLRLQAQLQMPIVALGAPVACYYPALTDLLNTKVHIPEHAHVANALGAIVGRIRQQQEIMITPSSGKQVTVHFPDGAQNREELEDAAAAAIVWANSRAKQKAIEAGATDIVVTADRYDNIVNTHGQDVFFECRIVATAIGRPAQAKLAARTAE
ncbi:MAG: hydantoinase/oxoprolinase family protein [Granulosicoccaceae bacterium]